MNAFNYSLCRINNKIIIGQHLRTWELTNIFNDLDLIRESEIGHFSIPQPNINGFFIAIFYYVINKAVLSSYEK